MTIEFSYNPKKIIYATTTFFLIVLCTNCNQNRYLEILFKILVAYFVSISITGMQLKIKNKFKFLSREVKTSKMVGDHFHQEKPPKFWWFFIFFILFF